METNDLKNIQNQEAENNVEKNTEVEQHDAEQGEAPHHKHHPHTNAILAASLGHSAVNHVRPRHSSRLEN